MCKKLRLELIMGFAPFATGSGSGNKCISCSCVRSMQVGPITDGLCLAVRFTLPEDFVGNERGTHLYWETMAIKVFSYLSGAFDVVTDASGATKELNSYQAFSDGVRPT